MNYVLSLDVGTTSLKGLLFDAEGNVKCSCVREYELLKPSAEIVELDPETYWESAVYVIGLILRESGVRPQEIMSVGLTSQAESLTVLDRHGKPLRNTIVWLDNRSGEEAGEIAESFDIEDVYRITGQQEIIPTWPATKMLWLRKHEPEVFKKADKYVMVEDYLVYRLTGGFVTDCALNPSSLYFDLLKYDWWDDMLSFLEIRREQLPELRFSGDVAGNISDVAAQETGLSTKTTVTLGPIDQVAGAVGAGNIEPGMISETTGAAMGICASVGKPVYDAKKRLGLYCHAEKGRYVLLPWVPTAGMVLRWFRDEFGGGRDYSTLCEEAENVPAGCEGLIMLPYLSGAGSPEFNPSARGVFFGIDLSHRRAHFVRAVLESIGFMLRANIELLEDQGCGIERVFSLGGASRSELWLRIKADICGKPLTVMECEETTCLGVAMLAFTGNGVFGDLNEAASNMVRTTRTVSPDREMREVYDRAYKDYSRLYKCVRNFRA